MNYIIVEWPEVQTLMEREGFEENSCLINSGIFLERYGSSAYFVDKYWYENQYEEPEIKTFVYRKLIKNTIWTEEYIEIDCETKEEALEQIKNLESFSCEPEYLYETVEEMSVEENMGFATIEIMDEDNDILWKNGK